MINKIYKKHILAFALISMSAAVAATNMPSTAARFVVSPLRVEIATPRNFAPFQVDNNGDQTLSVQARIFTWTQLDGEDQYTPTTDVIVTPSIVRISAQSTQHFKIVQRNATTSGTEQRYRIVVDQLPNTKNASNSAATTRLRVAVPIFVGRSTAIPSNVKFSIDADRIRVVNSGGQSAKIGAVVIHDSSGIPHDLKNSSARYVHGGSYIFWTLPKTLGCLRQGSEITGTIDGEAFRAELAQAC